MKKEQFTLITLSESQTKELANAISNENCRKIMQFLSENTNATESEIAARLNLPISTVHYNLQQLMKGKLIVAEEYHYSAKGREVNHYKLTHQYIVIAPKSEGLVVHLKSIIACLTITGFLAGIIQYLQKTPAAMLQQATESAPRLMSAPVAESETLEKAASVAMDTGANLATEGVKTTWITIGAWFFIGAIAGLTIYLLIEKLRKR